MMWAPKDVWFGAFAALMLDKNIRVTRLPHPKSIVDSASIWIIVHNVSGWLFISWMYGTLDDLYLDVT